MKIQRAIFVDRGGRSRSHNGRGRSGAEERSSNLSPQCCRKLRKSRPRLTLPRRKRSKRLAAPPDNQIQQIELLGKLNAV